MRQQKRTKRESRANINDEASGAKNESGTTNRGSTDKMAARLQTEIEVRIGSILFYYYCYFPQHSMQNGSVTNGEYAIFMRGVRAAAGVCY